MKKIAYIPILMLLLLAGSSACAQSALYKAMLPIAKQTPKINVIYIPNYPIDKEMSVAVTLLQAEDSATFKLLMKTLLALPYTHDKTGQRNKNAQEFAALMNQLAANPGTCSESTKGKALGHISNMNLTITPVQDGENSTRRKTSFSTFRTDPLEGDKGFYEVFHSDSTLQIMVFHCPDNDMAARLFEHLLTKITDSLKKK